MCIGVVQVRDAQPLIWSLPERATLSIKSRRDDTLRRAVREDDQRTLILDVTGAKEANKANGSAQDAP